MEERQKKRSTRADVAKRAGVSQTTVAYVLNDTKGVKLRQDTRQRVHKAAKELAYQPTFSARCMKKGKTELIGLMIPDYATQFTPFYSQIIQGACDAAADSNYHFISLTQDRESKSLRCLRENYLDGLIYIQSMPNRKQLEYVMDFGLPLVTINQIHELETPKVTMDYEAAMEDAVEYQLKNGAKNLLFVCGEWDNQPMQRYRETYDQLANTYGAKLSFSTLQYPKSIADNAFFQALDAGPWDGLIVDGFECARAIVRHWADLGAPMHPVFVFSESFATCDLGDHVHIYQSQAYQSGKLAWQLLEQKLEGETVKNEVFSLPFIDFAKQKNSQAMVLD